MSEMAIKQLQAVVSGRVQGVGFRYFTQRQAVHLNLVGWVRNRWNGTVQIVAEGSEADLSKLFKAIQRGPHAGTTQNVTHHWREPTGDFYSFRIRRTG